MNQEKQNDSSGGSSRISRSYKRAYGIWLNQMIRAAHFGNQSETARSLGIRQPSLSKYLKGQVYPDQSTRDRIQTALQNRASDSSIQLTDEERKFLAESAAAHSIDEAFDTEQEKYILEIQNTHHIEKLGILTKEALAFAKENYLNLAMRINEKTIYLQEQYLNLEDAQKILFRIVLEDIPERPFMHLFSEEEEAEEDPLSGRLLMLSFENCIRHADERPRKIFLGKEHSLGESEAFDIASEIYLFSQSCVLGNERPISDTMLFLLQMTKEEWYVLYLIQRMQVFDEYTPGADRMDEMLAYANSLRKS